MSQLRGCVQFEVSGGQFQFGDALNIIGLEHLIPTLHQAPALKVPDGK